MKALGIIAVALASVTYAPDVDAGQAKRLRRPGERVEMPVKTSPSTLLITDDGFSDSARLARPKVNVVNPRAGQRLRDNQERTTTRAYRTPGERLNQRVLGRLETRLQNRIGPSELPSTRTVEGTAVSREGKLLPSPERSQ